MSPRPGTLREIPKQLIEILNRPLLYHLFVLVKRTDGGVK